MTIVFISNFFNHHQKYISDYWYHATNRHYWFIATMEMPEEQKKLGYKEFNEDYIIKLNKDNRCRIKEIVNKADIVIIGSGDETLLDERIRSKKLIYRYSERIFKNDISLPRFIRRAMIHRKKNPSSAEMYLLCASAFAAQDFMRCGLFKRKCFKWGYFPQTKKFEDISAVISNKDKRRLLWCGRLIDWKNPCHTLEIAKKLKDNGYNFRLKIIGDGQLYEKMQRQIFKLSLENVVEMTGALPSDTVRDEMEKAGIYLFTSDFSEGWGAVLNESMNSGCAVVASHAVGSVPFLLKHKKNGLIYKSGDIDSLYEEVATLLDNPKLQDMLGLEGYRTITEEWSPEIAAQRLMELSSSILNKQTPVLPEDGPCSRAELLNNDWFQ